MEPNDNCLFTILEPMSAACLHSKPISAVCLQFAVYDCCLFTLTLAVCLYFWFVYIFNLFKLLICLLFQDGIPYLRPSDELKIKDIISDRQILRQTQTTPNGTPFVVPEKDREFLEEIYKKVETFLNSQESQELLLEGYNGFQRRLIYNTVKPKFSSEFCFHMETVLPKGMF